MKLTPTQRLILSVLELEADLPIEAVARRCRIKTPTAQYAHRELIESGIIVGRTPHIDLSKLGLWEFGFIQRTGSDNSTLR